MSTLHTILVGYITQFPDLRPLTSVKHNNEVIGKVNFYEFFFSIYTLIWLQNELLKVMAGNILNN